jgi:hypothetical protein
VRVRSRYVGLGNPACQLASVQAPAASKAPAPPVLKATASKTPAKQASDKTKESSGNAKVAVVSAD